MKISLSLDVLPEDGPVEILQKRDKLIEYLDERIEAFIDKRDPAQAREVVLELTRQPVPHAYLRRALESIFRGSSEEARGVMFQVRDMIDQGELGITLDWKIVRSDWRKGKEEAKR